MCSIGIFREFTHAIFFLHPLKYCLFRFIVLFAGFVIGLHMNGYQKIVLIFGAAFLLITLLPTENMSRSVFSTETMLEVLGIFVVMGLFLYAFKDLGEKRGKRRKK